MIDVLEVPSPLLLPRAELCAAPKWRSRFYGGVSASSMAMSASDISLRATVSAKDGAKEKTLHILIEKHLFRISRSSGCESDGSLFSHFPFHNEIWSFALAR